MTDILERLYAAKATTLVDDEAREPIGPLRERAEQRRAERRSFRRALEHARGPAIIAEIKRASPSRGLIARNMDPAAVARTYGEAGADAISVLTEADHFLGEIAYLDVARANASVPILRKDFLTTPYQVVQSAAYGADALLAIVAGLDDLALRAIIDEAEHYDLDVLVEVHDEAELKRAVTLGATVLGINNRNLRTFETDLAVTEAVLPHVPPGFIVISESGIGATADIERLTLAGARGFLIGESLMAAADPRARIGELKSVSIPAL